MKHKVYIDAIALGFLLTGCGPSSAPSPVPAHPAAKIQVVAAENFYGEVAQEVGGDQADVKSILTNPAADPHEYDPTPETAKEVVNAKIVIYNGIGYDSWMEHLLKSDASGNSKTTISVSSDLLGKKVGDNPHVWYDPSTMPKLAVRIADELAKADPGHGAYFHQRAQDYIVKLQPLQNKIQSLKQPSNTPINVSEPVFDYMAAALNMSSTDIGFAKAIEQGNDPTVQDVRQLQDDIQSKHIKLFVYNTQAQSPTVDQIIQLCKKTGIPVVPVSETEPAGKSYLQWMIDQLDEVEKALKGR